MNLYSQSIEYFVIDIVPWMTRVGYEIKKQEP